MRGLPACLPAVCVVVRHSASPPLFGHGSGFVWCTSWDAAATQPAPPPTGRRYACSFACVVPVWYQLSSLLLCICFCWTALCVSAGSILRGVKTRRLLRAVAFNFASLLGCLASCWLCLATWGCTWAATACVLALSVTAAVQSWRGSLLSAVAFGDGRGERSFTALA